MSDLEKIIEEMLECISNGSDTWGYTGYFAERIEAARKHVVRCRSCKFYEPNRDGVLGGCTLLDFYTKGMENGFCAWGERKES